MTEHQMLKKRTIKLLGDIIENESAKPDEETDFALIEECENLLFELVNDSMSLSDEDINERIIKVTRKNSRTLCGKAKKRISRIIAIACASIALCIGVGAVACLIDPKILDGIRKVLKYNVGESINIDGITFINDGEMRQYETIDELLDGNDIDIMYPHELPDGVYIEYVYVSEETVFPIDIVLSDHYGMICIYKTDSEDLKNIKATSESIEVNGIIFFVKQTHEQWSALAYDELYTYHISCFNKDILQIIMKGFRK